MREMVVQIKMTGPESVVISREERYELIAQVARALQERREAVRQEFDRKWEAEDSIFDFSRAAMDLT